MRSAGHSFTQLILRPYGWVAPPTVPPNDAFAEAVGDQMAAAIEQVHGMSYTNQPSADLYPVCGCAIDFLYETTLGVTFTMELRPASSLGNPTPLLVPPAVSRPFWARFVPLVRRPFALSGFLAPTRRKRAKLGRRAAEKSRY